MGFRDLITSLFAKMASSMHARLLDSEREVVGRYGRPTRATGPVTLGTQQFEKTLTFQVGSSTVHALFIAGELVRLVILPPNRLQVTETTIVETKQRYSADWLDLSQKPGLPLGLRLFMSADKRIIIEVDRQRAIAVTVTEYFHTPSWLEPSEPLAMPCHPTAAQIGANMTLAPKEPIGPEDLPRCFRSENNTTTPSQGWVSYVIRDLEDVDSLLAVKRLRSPDAELRNSIQPGDIKELWLCGIAPEIREAFIVYVIVLFKSPFGQLSGRGWFTQGPKETAGGQKPQCDEFRDAAVAHYRQILKSLSVSGRQAAAPQSISGAWMRPETRAESAPEILIYHLIEPKDVASFIDDSRVNKKDIKGVGSTVQKDQTSYILGESSVDFHSELKICIYAAVFWRNAGGHLHTMICVTLGTSREVQLQICKAFRQDWYNRFRAAANTVREFADATLAKHASSPMGTEGLPLAISGTTEMTSEGSGFRAFALMNTGQVSALIDELGSDARQLAEALTNMPRGEVRTSAVRAYFKAELFLFSIAFYRTRAGALAAAGIYVQGPASVGSLMDSFSKSALNQVRDHLRRLQNQEAQNN
jgi:hypothetical protein